MPIESFSEARVVITGGASGIGLALAKRMHADGARIALCDRDVSAIQTAIIAMPDVLGFICDVADPAALEGFITEASSALGGLDVGWNNAGIMPKTEPIQDMDWDTYRRIMDVNLDAVVRGSQIMARLMIGQGTPSLILNTGSENSLFHGVPGGSAYVASKVAVRAMTESLFQDTPDHIDVKLLCPGFVNTSLGPQSQFRHGMDVERFADIAFPLLSTDQFYLVSHGYNAVRVRDAADRILADIEAGAAPAAETKAFDTYTLMGIDR